MGTLCLVLYPESSPPGLKRAVTDIWPDIYGVQDYRGIILHRESRDEKETAATARARARGRPKPLLLGGTPPSIRLEALDGLGLDAPVHLVV
jgi:hypothetical protein